MAADRLDLIAQTSTKLVEPLDFDLLLQGHLCALYPPSEPRLKVSDFVVEQVTFFLWPRLSHFDELNFPGGNLGIRPGHVLLDLDRLTTSVSLLR